MGESEFESSGAGFAHHDLFGANRANRRSPSLDGQSHDSTSATANARFATSGSSIDANMDAE